MCNVCGSSFKIEGNLKNHIQKIHEGNSKQLPEHKETIEKTNSNNVKVDSNNSNMSKSNHLKTTIRRNTWPPAFVRHYLTMNLKWSYVDLNTQPTTFASLMQSFLQNLKDRWSRTNRGKYFPTVRANIMKDPKLTTVTIVFFCSIQQKSYIHQTPISCAVLCGVVKFWQFLYIFSGI